MLFISIQEQVEYIKREKEHEERENKQYDLECYIDALVDNYKNWKLYLILDICCIFTIVFSIIFNNIMISDLYLLIPLNIIEIIMISILLFVFYSFLPWVIEMEYDSARLEYFKTYKTNYPKHYY